MHSHHFWIVEYDLELDPDHDDACVSNIIQYWHLKINETISIFYSGPLSSILEYTTQFGDQSRWYLKK